MIYLKVRDYCHKCNEFSPVVESYGDSNREITCIHARRCGMIFRDAYKKCKEEINRKCTNGTEKNESTK